MALTETLELDARSAVSTIQSLGQQLEQIAASFRSGLQEALTVLATPLTAEVAVAADTAEAEAEIAGLAGDAEPVEIEVEANTEEAAGALDDLGVSAEGASEGLVDATGASDALDQSLTETNETTSTSVLAIDDLSGAATVAAAGIAALVAATTVLFTAGLEAESSQQAFNAALGDSAAAVEKINLFGLDTTLGDLVISLGASDEAIRNSTIGLFNFAEASTGSASEAETFVEELLVLAATVAAKRPDLDLEQVFTQLSTGLSRGGRALQDFAIDLRAPEIRAFAQELAGAGEEVTQFDLVNAGLQLSLQQLEDPLATIEAGVANVGIEFESFKQVFGETLETIGAPLVAPILDLLNAGLPLVVSLFESVAAVVTPLIPVVEDLVVALQPFFEAFSTALADAAPELVPVFEKFGDALIDLLEAVEPLIPLIADGLVDALILSVEVSTKFVEAITFMVEVGELFATGLGVIVAAVEDFIKSLPGLGPIIEDIGGGIAAVTNLIPGLESAVGDATEATKALAPEFTGLSDGVDNAVGTFERLRVEVDKVTERLSADDIKVGLSDIGGALETVTGAAVVLSDTMREELAGEAIAALEAYSAAAVDTVGITLAAFEDFNDDGLTSLTEFSQSLRNQVLEQQQFLNDINVLRERGATDLALQLLTTGADAKDAAREATLLSDDQLSEQEAFIDETLSLNDLQRVGAEALADDLVTTADALQRDVGLALGAGFLTGPLAAELAAAQEIAEAEGQAIGLGISEGIIEGLNLADPKLQAKLDKLARRDIIKRVRDLLGVFSPSTVFAGIGADIIDGLVIGLDGGTATAITALADGLTGVTVTGTASTASTGAVVSFGAGAIVVNVPEGTVDPERFGNTVGAVIADRVQTSLLRTEMRAG